jgi:hypothetical protein
MKEATAQTNEPTNRAIPRRKRAATGQEKLLTLQQASREYGPPYGSLREVVLKNNLGVRLGDDARRIWVRRSDLQRLFGV